MVVKSNELSCNSVMHRFTVNPVGFLGLVLVALVHCMGVNVKMK